MLKVQKSLWRSGAAPLLLFVFVVLRWAPVLTTDHLLDDEAIYFAAFSAVAEGHSPYGDGYLYPPIFARVGAHLLDLIGQDASLLALRLANLVGLTCLLWISLSAVQDLRLRWLLAALVAGLSPAVDIALRWGNLTPAIAALLITALLALDGRGLFARLLARKGSAILRASCGTLALTASILLKPLGAVVPVLLLLPTPRRGGEPRRIAPFAACAALMLMACGLLLTPGLAEFLRLGDSPERSGTAGHSVSALRLLYVLGIKLTPLSMIFLVLLLAFGFWARHLRLRGLGRWEWLSYLSVATLLATPIVWNHTTLVSLPVQAAALAIWLRRRRRAPWWEGGLVFLAVLSQHLSSGVGGIHQQAQGPLAMAIAVPALAPLGLLLYQLRHGADAPMG